MIIDNTVARRLGIFFFYDPDGIVDRYVDYFVNEYKKCFEKLVVVCNGVLSESGRAVFEKYTSYIIVRENKGLDVWAYKTAFDTIGWKELEAYDEVTIANYTSMGPVYPFTEMYAEMDTKDLDFWGINKHFYYKDDVFGKISYGYIPEHIQSYYMVFRQSLVKSKQFQDYWNNMPEIKSYEESIARFEAVFTKIFADAGFKWDVYVQVDDLKSLTLHPMLTYPTELIKNRKCPIFKRRSFFQDYNVVLDATLGQEARELYEYLRDNQLYDVDMIWENILRTCHQADIVKNLHLNYVLSCEPADEEKMKAKLSEQKTALFMHLYFMDLLESSFEYASAMPEYADVYITTDSEEKKQQIYEKFKELKCGHLEVRVIQNRGRDVSSILIGLRDVVSKYDVACFFHDKKAGQVSPGSVGDSFGYKCSKNVLYNRAYVYRILDRFAKEPRLGLLSPPEPNHGPFFTTLGYEWCFNYEVTKKLADRLGLHVPMAEDKAPVAPLGSVFWFRTKALAKLHEYPWTYEDFPEEPLPVNGTISHAIERIRPYVAQEAGYYPALVMAEPFAEIEVTNLRHYVQNYNTMLNENGLLAGSQREILTRLELVCEGKNPNTALVPWYMRLNSGLKGLMPEKLYASLLHLKRQIFGPRDLL